MVKVRGHADCTTGSSVGAEGVGGIGIGGRCRGSSSRSGGGGHVDTDRVLSSAWVVHTASGLARGVALGALVDALVAGLSADVIGHCLGVLGCVGGDAIAANAGVDQCVLVCVSLYTGGCGDVETYGVAVIH